MNEEVRRVFGEVADLAPAERARYYDIHHVAAPVRAEVDHLIGFDSPKTDLADHVAASVSHLLSNDGESGKRCGPFRLLRLIGSGGMGSVYFAERADGEVEHRAAVKLLRYGDDEPAFLERFLRERQILARLDHPSIARLIDAGRTSSGQPYLAMDYVEGLPIDEYVKDFDWRAKVKLFLEVCDAVSYAHRNLIVHRDLKPSNILVDRQGRPKLLDFGIAKILDDSSQSSEQTSSALMALTPQYASPEQVIGEPVTTASDVYSLGVVLYKMLTGRTPYDVPTLNPAAMARAVCETEPAPPHVTADLDNILRMALRKEPARRYLSVQQFSDDLGRALTDRPVLARPDTIRYRATKFIRRNRLSLGVAVLASIAVAASGIVAINQGRVAQRRFQDVRKLAHTFVFDLDDQIAKVDGTTKARETIVKTGLDYLDNLAKNSGGDLELQKEIALGYMKIGDVQGYPTKPNLGRTADALASYNKALEIYKATAAANPSYLPDLAHFYSEFAFLVRLSGDLNQARTMDESAIATFDRARLNRAFGTGTEVNYLNAVCTLGDLDEDLGRYRQSWAEFSHCGNLVRALYARDQSRQVRILVAEVEERLGTSAQNLGHMTEALHALDEDESMLNQLLAAEPRNPVFRRQMAILHQFRSSIYFDDLAPNLGDPRRALESSRRYLEGAEQMVRGDPNNASARYSQAAATDRVSLDLSEFDAAGAVRMAKESLRLLDELGKSAKNQKLIASERISILERLGRAEWKAGQLKEARASVEAALTLARPAAASTPKDSLERQQLVAILLLAARIEAAARDFNRAESLAKSASDEAIEIAKSPELIDLLTLASAEEAKGDIYALAHRTSDARASYQRLASIWQRFPERNEFVELQRASAARLLASLR